MQTENLKQRALFVGQHAYRFERSLLTPRWVGIVVSTHWCDCPRPCCNKKREVEGPSASELRAMGWTRPRRFVETLQRRTEP